MYIYICSYKYIRHIKDALVVRQPRASTYILAESLKAEIRPHFALYIAPL